MNEFQKTILRPILESQLAIEKAALESLRNGGDPQSTVGYNLCLIHESKIKEIKRQLDSLNVV